MSESMRPSAERAELVLAVADLLRLGPRERQTAAVVEPGVDGEPADDLGSLVADGAGAGPMRR